MPQVSYNDPLPAGRDGQLYDVSYYKDALSLINSNPQAAQVWTVTVSGSTANTLYTININGIPVSYLSDGSTSQQEIADGLVAAVNDEPAVSGIVSAASGTNAFTLTARLLGTQGEFVVSEDSGQLSAAITTAAANADPVPFGRAVVRTGDRAGRLISAADFVGTIAVFSFTASDSQTYVINLIVDGVSYAASFTAGVGTSAALIAAGLAAAVDALAIGLDGSVINTTELQIAASDGVSFEVSTTSAGTGAIALESYTPQVKPHEIFVAQLTDSYDYSEMIAGGLPVGVYGYPPNRTMTSLRKGRIIVPTEESISIGDPIYVRVAVNGSLDQIGAFRKSANTGCVRLDSNYPNLSWNKGISASQAVLQLG